MEQLILEFLFILPISIGIGVIASMTGISGGAFMTPLLIILFALTAELAAAASLLAVFFVAFVSTIGYYRQDPRPIDFRVGLLLVVATIPGTYMGVVLRTTVADLHLLRLTFGVLLFPVAVKLLFSLLKISKRSTGNKDGLDFSQLDKKRLMISVIATFLAGISAGLLGLGGGVIIVPMLCIILEFPMVEAAATSMFTMIFTSVAGSVMNYLVFIQSEHLIIFLYYGLTLGVGMIIGGAIGPKYASRVDGVLLQRIFGFILIFPLVKMMAMGHLWLDPNGSDFILATTGDAIIWLLIGIPLLIVSSHRIKSKNKEHRLETTENKPPIGN
jgi:uncharacterized membrane protein YfcA